MRAPAGAKLLEREAELDELQAALESARAGTGGLLVVEGAAGIGKTRLLQAARETAERTGMRVLRSRGSELERDFPFALVRQLFEPALTAVEPAEREQLLSGAARMAGPVVGMDPEEAAVDAGDLLVDPSFATLNALYWLTSNLAEARPMLLAVDDAHWADQPSLRFFGFLFARLEDVPVLLTLAARPSEPGAGSVLLAQLTADPAARVVRPRALSRNAVAELIREGLTADAHDEFCAACHEATAGNPFMLRELIRELAADGSSGTAGEAARVRDVAPATIQRAVLVRLGRLPDPAPRLAQAIAVLGDDAEPQQAAELAGIDRDAAAQAADALAVAGILEAGSPWRFIHPLVRNAVYADIPGGAKAAAHRQAAKLLEHLGAEPERVSVHLLATEPDCDPDVVETLGGAAQRALDRAAPEAAIAYLRRALIEPPGADMRANLVWRLVHASFRAADRGTFKELLEAGAIEIEELVADPQRLVTSADQLSFALWGWERIDEMVALFERAISAAIDADDYDLVTRLESFLVTWGQMSPAEARARFDRHKDHIEPDTPSERLWLTLQAWWGLLTGESAASVTELARRGLEGGRVFHEQPDSAVPNSATFALVLIDELDAAERAIDHYFSALRTRVAAPTIAGGTHMRGALAYARGDISHAEIDARTAVEAGRQGGFLRAFPNWVATLVEILIERDDLAAAEAELVAGAMTGPVPERWWFTGLLFSRARLRLAQGRASNALEDLVTAGGIAAKNGMQAPFSPAGSYVALAIKGVGEHAQARQVAEQELEDARGWGLPRRIGFALRTLGVMEGGEKGLELLREALAVLEPSPAKLEYIRALADYGAALRRANRRAEAREPLRTALEWARTAGALAIAKQAHEELQATGEKLRPLLATGVESLTPSERRIAEMAADGLSNKKIAQELFLTVKTVETHLSHAYRKLDIRSRSELGQALANR
jgi:DNA-binding CsgD family transcriptional regulator